MKIDLENKIALVARGNDDIGRAICAQLAESGASVIALVAELDDLEQSRIHFEKTRLDIDICHADIANFTSCEKVIEEIESRLGKIDFVINNAESPSDIEITKMSEQSWHECLQVNLHSAYNLCRMLSERMSERGFGRIVNISSMYGRKGESGKSAFAASKFGLHGFTMALAQELARKGVTVNTVSPGQLNVNELKNKTETEINNIIAEIPASRLGKVEEVASLVDFLCSNQAGFITGTDIAINGGQYIH